MKERPILFSSPMVRAILEGRKTQTRRVVKPIKLHADHGLPMWDKAWNDTSYPPNPCLKVPFDGNGVKGMETTHRHRCPHGLVGDRLCVREAWKYCGWSEDGEPKIRYAADGAEHWPDVPEEWGDRVQDIWAELSKPSNFNIDNVAADRRWRSSRFMPRWASRLTLEITGVRVERLQAISEADAIAEGVTESFDSAGGCHERKTAKENYAALWDSINGKGSWAANPWVWVVEFRRVQA